MELPKLAEVGKPANELVSFPPVPALPLAAGAPEPLVAVACGAVLTLFD